jgi:iron(III) transport system substrate-binding protein
MKRVLIVGVLLSAMCGVALAQSTRPNNPAELAKYTGSDRERLLYEGARKESKLVWYTTLVPHKEIAKTFEAKYPGISVEVYRADGTELSNRLLAETQAKRYIADAIETTPAPLMQLRDSNALLPYLSPHLAIYPEIAKERASAGLVFWTTDRESLTGVGYNKNAMAASEIPKKFDDLLKPGLKGKLATANNETGARAVGAIVKSKGEAFVRKLKEQEIRPYAITAAGLADLIISGEVPISFTAIQTNLTQPAAARGAPVAWTPMELVAVNAGGAAVSANASHPNAALLFVDFLLSPYGQKMYGEKFFYGSAAKDYGFERWYPEKGLTIAEYEERADHWMKLLREITRK